MSDPNNNSKKPHNPIQYYCQLNFPPQTTKIQFQT